MEIMFNRAVDAGYLSSGRGRECGVRLKFDEVIRGL